MVCRFSLAGFILLCWTTVVSAQESLRIIPHDAGAALVVRNLEELRKHSARAAVKTALGDLNFSKFTTDVLRFVGLNGVVDETKAIAIMAVSAKSVGAPPLKNIIDFDVLNLIVLAMPFKDRDEIGLRVGLKRGELKADQVQRINPRFSLFPLNYSYVRGNHLFIGASEKAVKHAATAKRLSETLSDDQLKAFGQRDVIVHMGTFVWGKAWEEILQKAGQVLGARMDAAEKDMAEKIVKSMAGVRFGLAGLGLEEARVSLTLYSAWDKENKYVQEILGLLRSSESPTDWRGLPEGDVIHAEAATGNGVANAMLARVLFKASMQELLATQDITTNTERPLIVGIFNEVWYNLFSNRMALYQNPDEKRHGKLALVAILDTADGEKFFDHFAHLACIADGQWHFTAKDADQLVADLLVNDRRRYELAMLKLRLLGEQAGPVLDKALMYPALEGHVALLRQEVKSLAAERRRHLPADNWILGFRPRLELLSAREKRQGVPVHVMKMKFLQQAGNIVKHLKSLLGPDWDKVRFAVHNKKVLMFMGSNTSLLDKALDNLIENKPGLAQNKYLQSFAQKVGPDRRIEFHLAVGPLLSLFSDIAVPPQLAVNRTLASISLSMQPDSLQLDFSVPLEEAGLLRKFFGW